MAFSDFLYSNVLKYQRKYALFIHEVTTVLTINTCLFPHHIQALLHVTVFWTMNGFSSIKQMSISFVKTYVKEFAAFQEIL
jgi:hypothetical protein